MSLISQLKRTKVLGLRFQLFHSPLADKTPSGLINRNLSIPQLPSCSFACNSNLPIFFLLISKLSATISSAGYLTFNCIGELLLSFFTASGVASGKIKELKLAVTLPFPWGFHLMSPEISSLLKLISQARSAGLAIILAELIRRSNISRWFAVKSMRLIETPLCAVADVFLSSWSIHSSMSIASRLPWRVMPLLLPISAGTLIAISPLSIFVIPFCETRAILPLIALPRLMFTKSCVGLICFFSMIRGIASPAVFPSGKGRLELMPIRLDRIDASVCPFATCAFADQSAPPVTLLGISEPKAFLSPESLTRPFAVIKILWFLSVLMLNWAGPP